MDYFFNELSLENCFVSQKDFEDYFLKFINLIYEFKPLLENLYTSQAIGNLKIYNDTSLHQSLMIIKDKDHRELSLKWLVDRIAYWESKRTNVEHDYFEYKSKCITDYSLGEAARRQSIGIPTVTYSSNSHAEFRYAKIEVMHGLKEEPLGNIFLENIYEADELKRKIRDSFPKPKTWKDYIEQLPKLFPNLVFSPDIIDYLKKEPIHPNVVKKSHELLYVLDLLVKTSENGSLNGKGMCLYKQHFVGERAWFTPESESNKRDFKEKLTFTDPSDSSKDLFCHFHGKINTPPYRIYFEWKRPPGQREIKVVYIGPKITKK